MTSRELLGIPEVRQYISAVLKGLPTGRYGRQRITEELCDHILSSVEELEKHGLPQNEALDAALEALGSPQELNQFYRESCAPEKAEHERYDGGSRKTDKRKLLRILIPGACLLVLAVALCVKFFSTEKPDMGVVFICDSSALPYAVITESDTGAICAAIEAAAGDLDGDGETELIYKYIDGNGNLGDEEGNGRPELEDNYFLTLNVFAEEDYVLYLCSPSMYKIYDSADYFDYAAELTGSALFSDDRFKGWYACIIDWASVGKGDAAQTEAARRVIDALLAG